MNDTGTFFTRNFAGLGQRAGADAGKEWVSGSCKPYIAKRQSGIERIRLLEMLNRCFRSGAGEGASGGGGDPCMQGFVLKTRSAFRILPGGRAASGGGGDPYMQDFVSYIPPPFEFC